jgi:hypothetical protein
LGARKARLKRPAGLTALRTGVVTQSAIRILMMELSVTASSVEV